MQHLPSPKVDRRSLDRRAADVLRQEILSGRFPPGYRLVETWLAQQLQVSRGTVRAALSELAHQGLVDQVAYTKWSVPDLKAQDAWELYTLRASLEGLASFLAAEALSPASVAELTASFGRLVAAAELGKVGPAVEADLALHKTIVALAGHGRLSKQYGILEQQVRRYMTSSNALINDTREIGDQHRPLVEAILAGRAAEAEALAKSHNMVEGRKLFDRLRQIEQGEGM
ncbi:MAG TPA: GntR family transcriptional regulator [Candidatus Udaeobacter sp.]|nr:GntR family transcriptional regulator [Candidatus Udaeobacter sp.]